MPKKKNAYRQLQEKLDTLPIGFPPTESGVEIRLLQYLFTEEEAQITLKLEMIPQQIDKIYKRAKSLVPDKATLEEKLDHLGEKGAINQHITRSGHKFYSLAFLAIGIFEFQVANLEVEFYKLFKEYLHEAFMDEVLGSGIPQLRTVPTEGSIVQDLPIMPYDKIREVISNDDREILVAECVCKKGQDLVGDPCKVTDEREICIIFGSSARKYERLGWGRRITKEECFQIMDRAEKQGLVVQPSNTEKPFALCLCCGCCCEILTAAKPLENPVQYFHTNYEAEVNLETCIGCGVCVKRCQMDAVKVVEKKAVVDYTRCIGCGVCVTTCGVKAMSLKQKKNVMPPAKNATELYQNILKKKVGNAKYMLMVSKQILKSKF